MPTQNQTFTPPIQAICRELESEFPSIPNARREKLLRLSGYLARKQAGGEVAKLVVICTHNSRRSHLGQLWLAVGAEYYGLPGVQTFSGGTEATAFNPRAVAALRSAGFTIDTDSPQAENPVYRVKWKREGEPYRTFSKKYEAAPNPRENFAAILVCSEADKGCPFVAGCDFRLALPFDDPKASDDTPRETAVYNERVRQIGREMLFVMAKVGEVK